MLLTLDVIKWLDTGRASRVTLSAAEVARSLVDSLTDWYVAVRDFALAVFIPSLCAALLVLLTDLDRVGIGIVRGHPELDCASKVHSDTTQVRRGLDAFSDTDAVW